MYADLHVHTSHSDGELAPAQVVGRAKEAGVSLLAICDHNLLSGSLEAAPLAARVGIRLVYGVEIDSLWRGVDLHVLGLNVDPEEPGLVRLARESRDALDGMSDTLLRRMRADGLPVSVEEFRARPAGGAKALAAGRPCTIWWTRAWPPPGGRPWPITENTRWAMRRRPFTAFRRAARPFVGPAAWPS